jgi:hypothetical protein
MNPETNSPAQYPSVMKKKKAPASSCPIFRFTSIVGMRGERITLERKLMKKIPTRNSSGPPWERKESSWRRLITSSPIRGIGQ